MSSPVHQQRIISTESVENQQPGAAGQRLIDAWCEDTGNAACVPFMAEPRFQRGLWRTESRPVFLQIPPALTLRPARSAAGFEARWKRPRT